MTEDTGTAELPNPHLDEAVARALADAPPLTDAQVERLVALLSRPGFGAYCTMDGWRGPIRDRHIDAHDDAVLHIHREPGGHHIGVEAVR